MQFREYVEERGRGTLELIAFKSGCSLTYLYSVKNGKKPSNKFAVRISKATHNRVTVDELMGLYGPFAGPEEVPPQKARGYSNFYINEDEKKLKKAL